MSDTRLIEAIFPLRQTSIDSVHEKNVRHGHISTLHIWPARRPLAASRAVLLATLLRDPGNPQARRALLDRIAGRLSPDGGAAGVKQETRGGILHWGRENSSEIEAFHREIREAFGGRAPRVLDPFAGGGAIPLEAMRLGCEVVAADLNPVAWFVLRCTLHYPRLLAGQTRPLPAFAVGDRAFATAFLQAQGVAKVQDLRRELAKLDHLDDEPAPESLGGLLDAPSPAESADLAWHLRAWARACSTACGGSWPNATRRTPNSSRRSPSDGVGEPDRLRGVTGASRRNCSNLMRTDEFRPPR